MAINEHKGNLLVTGESMSLDEWDDSDDIYNSLVEDLMRSWQRKYCKFTNLRLFVGTYNVNNQSPSESLRPWLADRISEPPDIYALGFQELDLSQNAFLYASGTATPKETQWANVVRECLHQNGDYIELKRIRLVGILLVVYIQRKHSTKIPANSVQFQTLPTGLWNRIGNKGGVAVSLMIEDTSVCFVNSHLAAGSDEMLRRNQDFRDISRLQFPQQQQKQLPSVSLTGIFSHDVTIWLGDLNYRLEDEEGRNLDNSYVRQLLVGDANFTKLLNFDQLIRMQKAKSAFHDYTEGEIKFLPTYKYDAGTDSWDSSEKARVPAWCDRVLWLAKPDELQQLIYDSVNQVRISDHKPVFALFDLTVKRIQESKYNNVLKEAIKESDRLANEALPQVDLEPKNDNIFDFGEVRFLEPKVLTLSIRNVGKYPVKFAFRIQPKNNSAALIRSSSSSPLSGFPPWLIVTPYSQKVDVGKECIVDIQVLIEKRSAWELNARNSNSLDDVLILKLRRGRDYFLTVNGTYIKSCFGQSLQALIGCQKPVQDVQLIDLGLPRAPELLDQVPVPKELYRLVEHIREHFLNNNNNNVYLFADGSSHLDFIKIRDCLDTGYPQSLPECERSFSLMEALFRLLDSLPVPIVPPDHQDRCLRVAQSPVACWQIVEQFPPVHRDAFVYLIQFAREIVQNSHSHDLKTAEICEMFSDLFFRTDTTDNNTVIGGKMQSQEKQMEKSPWNNKSSDSKRRAVQFVESCLNYDRETAIKCKLFENKLLPNYISAD